MGCGLIITQWYGDEKFDGLQSELKQAKKSGIYPEALKKLKGRPSNSQDSSLLAVLTKLHVFLIYDQKFILNGHLFFQIIHQKNQQFKLNTS